MGNRIHPQPGEPFCGNCHADDDTDCTPEHQEYCTREAHEGAYRDVTSTVVYQYDLHVEYKHRSDGQWELLARFRDHSDVKLFGKSLPRFEEMGAFLAEFLYKVALENGARPRRDEDTSLGRSCSYGCFKGGCHARCVLEGKHLPERCRCADHLGRP